MLVYQRVDFEGNGWMASPFSGDSLNVLIMAHMMQIIQFDFRESTMINYDQFTLWLFNIPIESIEKGASFWCFTVFFQPVILHRYVNKNQRKRITEIRKRMEHRPIFQTSQRRWITQSTDLTGASERRENFLHSWALMVSITVRS